MLPFLVLSLSITSTLALDNGLALTPPMGWLTWERYRCITDCKNYPNDCISERLIKRTADLMVREGFLAAGYEYVGIDDCWLEKERSPEGLLVPDRERFPSGMKNVADYIHARGLKFALYEDYGTKTCAGYPGVLHHEKTDIDTFVGWDVDYIKLDGCYIAASLMDTGYPEFGKLLNESGRPIVYSCSWPAYQEDYRMKPDYASIADHCNLWRNWGDINDNWASVSAIIDWFGDNQDRIAKYAGPGHWNDPDMLVIGNYGLTYDQSRVQMAIWAILAAPLMISVDLSTIRPEYKEILLNRYIIAVNQDPMGKQGLRVYKNMTSSVNKEIWRRELQDGGFALAFLDRSHNGVYPKPFTFTFDQMGIPRGDYIVEDLYQDEEVFILKRHEKLTLRINPSGVKMFKFKRTYDSIEEDSTQINVDQDNQLPAAAA